MDDEGFERVMARSKVTREQAIGYIRKWWSGLFMAHHLNQQALITECQLIYVPFWKIRANVSGRVLGYEYATESDIYKDVNIDQDYLWNGIACDAREIGLKYLRDPEIDTEPYDPHPGPVADLTISMKDAMAHGRSLIECKALKDIDVPHIICKRINVETLEVMLIYYPIWAIKYSYFEQNYWATIDGLTGNILAGRAPADLRLRRQTLSAGMIITIFGTVLSLWIMFNISSPVAPLLVITIVVTCLTIIWGAFAFYCSYPEIVIEEFGQKSRHYDGLDRFVFDDAGAIRKDYTN